MVVLWFESRARRFFGTGWNRRMGGSAEQQRWRFEQLLEAPQESGAAYVFLKHRLGGWFGGLDLDLSLWFLPRNITKPPNHQSKPPIGRKLIFLCWIGGCPSLFQVLDCGTRASLSLKLGANSVRNHFARRCFPCWLCPTMDCGLAWEYPGIWDSPHDEHLTLAFNIWVWVKIKAPGDRRF